MNNFGKKCFDENRDLFGDSQSAPEKWNLYNGLAGMAEDLQHLKEELAALRQEIAAANS